jgi:hypothetical protein
MAVSQGSTGEPPNDSMAARLAKQRQQRSLLRSALAFDELTLGNVSVGADVAVLRAELTASGKTIAQLQRQLAKRNTEMEQMGQQTMRMREELLLLQEKAITIQQSSRMEDG